MKEVVFSPSSPDIEEYKTYYESIDPENAEALYIQVVKQYVYDKEVQDDIRTYSSMPAKSAAAIFDQMVTDGKTKRICSILSGMDVQSRADILAKMDPKNAATLTVLLEPKK